MNSFTEKFVRDPKGFFLIYLDEKREKIVVEHYHNSKLHKAGAGKLNVVIEGTDGKKILREIERRGLIGREDHRQYMERELIRAQEALERGTEFVQA